jgi:ribosome-associated toxin RatA of RatAB toxin-antitoxin module
VEVSLERTLPISLNQAMTLIEEVERYPEFLPRVREVTDVRRNVDNGVTDIEMSVRVGFRALSGKARTRLVVDRIANSAKMNLIEGPFRHATVKLQLRPSDAGTQVLVEGAYETQFTRFESLVEQKLTALVDTVMSAVRQRAQSRFGG